MDKRIIFFLTCIFFAELHPVYGSFISINNTITKNLKDEKYFYKIKGFWKVFFICKQDKIAKMSLVARIFVYIRVVCYIIFFVLYVNGIFSLDGKREIFIYFYLLFLILTLLLPVVIPYRVILFKNGIDE